MGSEGDGQSIAPQQQQQQRQDEEEEVVAEEQENQGDEEHHHHHIHEEPTTSASHQFDCQWPTPDAIGAAGAAAPSPALQAAAVPGYASSPVRYMWGGIQPLMPPFATYNPYGQPGPPPGHFGAKAFQMAQSGPADAQQADSPSKGKPVKNGHFGHSSSGSDGSSEGSEDDNSNNNNKNAFHQMAMEVLESSNTAGMFGSCSGSIEANPTGVPNALMDYWSGSVSRVHRKSKHSLSVPQQQPLVPAMPSSLLGAAASARDGSDMWSQDERELKRQRRKQSNRESARRSRLRKQAECEELSTRVDALAVENAALRSELGRLMEERNKLAQENVTLMEQVLEKSQHEQDTMFAPN